MGFNSDSELIAAVVYLRIDWNSKPAIESYLLFIDKKLNAPI